MRPNTTIGMSLESASVTSSNAEIFRAALADTGGEVFAVNLDEEQLTALVETINSLSKPPTIRSLSNNSVARWLRDDFLLASTVADELAAGNLSLRTTEPLFKNTLLVTEETVVVVISTDEHVAGLVTDDEEFVASAREEWADEWDSAAEFSLRTPPRSAVHESLAAEIGEETDADFRAMLDSVDTTRGEEALDVVEMSLLAAAKNEIQLYEISTWGEDAGVASRATFSRMKTQLEEGGVITTEKIPIDVGRPRFRLLLADELRGIDAGDLVEQVRKVMFAAPA
jgi:hypothetical protein